MNAIRLPNREGLSLWEVRIESSWYDDDPRMPSDMLLDREFFVLAHNHEEAMKKAKPLIKKYLKTVKVKYTKPVVKTTPVALENLHVARDCSGDGRLGWIPGSNLEDIALSDPADAKKFRLGVCLISTDN